MTINSLDKNQKKTTEMYVFLKEKSIRFRPYKSEFWFFMEYQINNAIFKSVNDFNNFILDFLEKELTFDMEDFFRMTKANKVAEPARVVVKIFYIVPNELRKKVYEGNITIDIKDFNEKIFKHSYLFVNLFSLFTDLQHRHKSDLTIESIELTLSGQMIS